MKFELGPQRNKENLLERYSELDLYSALGVPVDHLNGKNFRSTFREDSNPTCRLYVSKSNRVRYIDYAYMDRPVDVFELVEYLDNCSFTQALAKLWDIMEGAPPLFLPSNRTRNRQRIEYIPRDDVKYSTRDFHEDDLNWWNSFGIGIDLLKRYRVHALSRVWIGDSIGYQYLNRSIYPAYVYEFNTGFKIYFPMRKDKRFLSQAGSYIQGYDQLDPEGDGIVITKSLKDVMLLASYGIASVAPQSEAATIDDETLTELKARFNTIVVVYDNDSAGISGLRKWKQLGVRICMIPRKWGVKDLTDFRKRYGSAHTASLINEGREYYLAP